jgi:Fe-S-cluster containining protein
MHKDPLKIKNIDATHFLDRLKSIFADMDRGYRRAAAHYGFDCHGCTDICCQTRFYHHTWVEFLMIQEGFKTLGRDMRAEIASRARAVVRLTADLERQARPVRLMCPLNFDNLCVLYPHRPMICRLHGIPHEFQNRAGQGVRGPGCETFDRRCASIQYFKFDRTPYYRGMAGLEKEFRQAVGLSKKIKMTLAEMLSVMNPASLSFRARRVVR